MCGLGIFFAVTAFVSAPILFAAGCASVLIFYLRAFAKFLRITKKDKAIWLAKVFDVLSQVLLGLTLITFGALAFAGLPLINISFIVSGVLFVAKVYLDTKYGSENKFINGVSEIIHKDKYLCCLLSAISLNINSFDENTWCKQKNMSDILFLI